MRSSRPNETICGLLFMCVCVCFFGGMLLFRVLFGDLHFMEGKIAGESGMRVFGLNVDYLKNERNMLCAAFVVARLVQVGHERGKKRTHTYTHAHQHLHTHAP